MEIWRRRAALMEIEDLKVYMYICVRNAAVRKLQPSRKDATVSLDDFAYKFTSTYINPEDAILTSEPVQKIQEVINGLPLLMAIKIFLYQGA